METRTQQSPKSSFKIKNNVSTIERVLMITSGAYILYNGLRHKEKSFAQGSLGGAMVLRGLGGYCPVYDAVDQLKNGKSQNVNIKVRSVIHKSVSEVYDFWRNLENLPKFMNHLDAVKSINHTISEWTAKGPAGIGRLSWKAQIVKDEKDKVLSWKSLPNSTIENSGRVIFIPKGKATLLDITISYRAPLGVAGESAAKLLNSYFEKIVKDDILNLKSYLESGHQ
jgi:uncharacterized membrane protein